jgi:hypothetical protein
MTAGVGRRNPKVAGMDGAVGSFVELFYSLG